jgi:hypothetical protein
MCRGWGDSGHSAQPLHADPLSTPDFLCGVARQREHHLPHLTTTLDHHQGTVRLPESGEIQETRTLEEGEVVLFGRRRAEHENDSIADGSGKSGAPRLVIALSKLGVERECHCEKHNGEQGAAKPLRTAEKKLRTAD